MPPINQDSLSAIQPELTTGEAILWAGRPNPNVIFHREDAWLIPFSLMWGSIAIVFEALAVRSHELLTMLCGIPFVVMGQYLIWGRFLYAAPCRGVAS
jgi:hypothetical protein